jgi:SAM-dependent methyltransferase
MCRVSAPAVIATLRDVLARASYDEPSVRELVCGDGLDWVRGLATLRLRPQGAEPLGRLVRLFLSGDELPADAAAGVLGPATLAELEAAGVVAHDGSVVRARIAVKPVRGLLVVSDPWRAQQRLPADHVIYPGPASETLASLTVRTPSADALDLGCGSGVQALLAARHAERVVATDINPRALELALLSAGLSGVENIDWREGDLFEPVSVERFDLVVSNPPFAISPGRELAFRDGGRSADELSREVVQGTAARLRDGGFGHVLCSWVRASGEPASAAPRQWLEGAGCDAVILHLDTQTPASYAVHWHSIEEPLAARAAERADAWMSYYRRLGIEAIATGLVVMRRRAGENWCYADELVSTGCDGGRHLKRVFEGHDSAGALEDDRVLLDSTLALADDVSLVERRRHGHIERARLTADGGIQLSGTIDPPGAAAAIAALDRHRCLAAAASDAGVAQPVLAAALPSIRALVRRGYLVVPCDPTP